MSAALIAKMAAENSVLKKENDELKTKLAAFEKRAASEELLLDANKNPRTPLDLRAVDVDDFIAKRAALEALPDLQAAAMAMKIASTGSFSVGDSDKSQTTSNVSTGHKASDEFTNHFLGHENS